MTSLQTSAPCGNDQVWHIHIESAIIEFLVIDVMLFTLVPHRWCSATPRRPSHPNRFRWHRRGSRPCPPASPRMCRCWCSTPPPFLDRAVHRSCSGHHLWIAAEAITLTKREGGKYGVEVNSGKIDAIALTKGERWKEGDNMLPAAEVITLTHT